MELTARNFWYESKSWFREMLGFSTDAAHIHAGLALFLIAAFALRRWKQGYVFAWLMVFVAQTVNEVLDARDWIMWTGKVNWSEMTKDYAQTLFWPSALFLIMSKMSRDLSS